MATPLAQRHCEVCTANTPTLSREEAATKLDQVPDWRVGEQNGRLELTKTFKFKGFMPGVELVNRIARIAEEEGHHPDLHLTYGQLKVDLTTHAAGGLTDNDFILAAKIDRLEP